MNRWGRRFLAVGTVTALAAPFLPWVLLNRMDDYLITLRYGRNAAHRLGAVFTEGERVQGFTSPLQFLVSAILSRLTNNPEAVPTLICLLGICGLIAIALQTARWANGGISIAASAITALIFFSSYRLLTCIGFDTVWAAALGVTAITALQFRKPLLCGVLTGLAILARHDAVLLALLLGIVLLHRRRLRDGVRFALPLLLLCAPWYIFAGLYYGNPLPNTLQTKVTQGASLYDAWSDDLTRAALDLLSGFPLGFLPFTAACLAAGIVVLVLRRRESRVAQTDKSGDTAPRSLPFALLGLWSALHFLAYFWILRVPHRYPWYAVYPEVFLLAVLAIGPAGLVARGIPAVRRLLSVRRPCVADMALATAAVVSFLIPAWMAAVHHRELLPRRNVGRYRHAGYREAAAWMLERIGPGDRINACEMGVLGWYMPGIPIEDSAGLTTRPHRALNSPCRFLVRPDGAAIVQDGLNDPAFQEIQRLPCPGEVDIVIFERHDAGHPPAVRDRAPAIPDDSKPALAGTL